MTRRHVTLASPVLISILVMLLSGNSDEIDPGTLTGRVTEPGGAALPGAWVELNCASSGDERVEITDADGLYRMENLRPANDCALRVSYPGGPYATVVQDRIVVHAGRTTAEGVQLFGERSEEVVVSAKVTQGRVVDLKEVGQKSEFTADFVNRIPVSGRNYQDVLTLAAGVVDPGPNVRGTKAENFNTIIDGTSNQAPLGGTFLANLNTDAIEQVEVIQTGADASFRRASGGFANIVGVLDGSFVADFNRETYARIVDNTFRAVERHPLSTFSVDVDTAAYSNVRRFFARGHIPPADAVRIEELINYFDYDYPAPAGVDAFSVSVETTGCPWAPAHRLARIGLKGREIPRHSRPPANLVFLIDVSGSMRDRDKLPLAKRSLRMLARELNPDDTVAIAVYAGAAGLVLPPTEATSLELIENALRGLESGGSTAGGAGLKLAYKVAHDNFMTGGVNRVVLATDGDFNVGVSNIGELTRMVEKQARKGVFFTVLGFGTGNLRDDLLEQIADQGNGHYAYIDTVQEARKVLVDEIGATLVTIAKDVKIQVEFNPAEVGAYRLIGYENRLLQDQDFDDDTRDAGDIGAGHTVTALYEIVPAGVPADVPALTEMRYQQSTHLTEEARSGELLTVNVRYKEPDGNVSRLLSFPVTDDGSGDIMSASVDTRFAAAVAGFGMVLRDSLDQTEVGLEQIENLAEAGLGDDLHGRRLRFLEMVRLANSIRNGGS